MGKDYAIKLGNKVVVDEIAVSTLSAVYECLLEQCCVARYGEDSKVHEKLFDWLRTTDMYTAPASTQYHEAYTGGLMIHSLKVYNEAMDLKDLPKFKKVTDADPDREKHMVSVAIVSLVHDWCKIGLYEKYTRNVKNEQTGQWEKVEAFRRNQKGIPLGHGVSSMFLASKFFNLSQDEALAIRWHQGRWNVPREEMNELQLANEYFPLVHLIQFADQLAIVNY